MRNQALLLYIIPPVTTGVIHLELVLQNQIILQDKNVWLSLVTKLRKSDQLPVVAFTLSRRRCDENAASLESLDLTSTSEKREIKVFFNKCIQRLKGSDKVLPQVRVYNLFVGSLLLRSIGLLSLKSASFWDYCRIN